MRKIGAFVYSIKQGIISIRRNKMFSMASVGTIAACLFIFGLFYLVILNFRYTMNNAEASVGISVFFDEGISNDEIMQIANKIKTRPEVKDIIYISPEDAWKKFKANYFKGNADLTATFGDDNPLSDSESFQVQINDAGKQQYLIDFVKQIDGVRQINSAQTASDSLSSFNVLVGYVSVSIILILLAVAVFLISTTVTMGISVRKEEIVIMRLIGASDFIIRAPFVVEGIIIGFIGAMVPLILLYVLYNEVIYYVSAKFEGLSGILKFIDVYTVFSSLGPVSLGIGVGIGFVGSYLTVRRHLRV